MYMIYMYDLYYMYMYKYYVKMRFKFRLKFANLSKSEVEDFVFVTAASDNHFRELKSALAQHLLKEL